MNITNCLDAKKLIQYYDFQLNQEERRNISIHLAECEICAKNLHILKAIDKTLLTDDEKGQKIEQNRMKEKECISNEILYDYLEGRVTDAHAMIIESHLNSCQICFQEFASLLRNSLSPMTDFEKSEISKLRNISAEEQVSKIISIVEGRTIPVVAVESEKISLISKLREKIRLFLSKFTFFKPQWRYATAFACLFLLALFIGYPHYKHWRSNSFANKGVAYLTSEYLITSETEPRPFGGFHYGIVGPTRDEYIRYTIDSAKFAFEKALELNSRNLLAHQFLGTYFLVVEHDFQKANYHYQFVYSHDSTNAAILNDLGVLALHLENFDEAVNKFSKALAYNPNLLEAQFNIALAYFKSGKGEKAARELNKYIELDPTRSWADVARKIIDQLKNK